MLECVGHDLSLRIRIARLYADMTRKETNATENDRFSSQTLRRLNLLWLPGPAAARMFASARHQINKQEQS
jgi:hypothetical protein